MPHGRPGIHSSTVPCRATAPAPSTTSSTIAPHPGTPLCPPHLVDLGCGPGNVPALCWPPLAQPPASPASTLRRNLATAQPTRRFPRRRQNTPSPRIRRRGHLYGPLTRLTASAASTPHSIVVPNNPDRFPHLVRNSSPPAAPSPASPVLTFPSHDPSSPNFATLPNGGYRLEATARSFVHIPRPRGYLDLLSGLDCNLARLGIRPTSPFFSPARTRFSTDQGKTASPPRTHRSPRHPAAQRRIRRAVPDLRSDGIPCPHVTASPRPLPPRLRVATKRKKGTEAA